jgi:WD40 repeat protein
MRSDTTDFGPIPGAAEEGPKRSRIGSSRPPLWNRQRTVLLLLGIIVLPWLPIFLPPNGATPAMRARGVGDVPIVGFAFSPDGATIATIQMDGRVALRATATGLSAHSFLDYRGPAQALAFSPDGRSLAVGGVEPDLFRYDIRDGGVPHPLGMPIRWVKGLVYSPDGRMLAASSHLHNEILLWDLAAGRERTRLGATDPP